MKRIEWKAPLNEIIDINNPFDLWIISFAIARDDLYEFSKSMLEANENHDDNKVNFFFKWSLGCSYEVYLLLKEAFNGSKKSAIDKNKIKKFSRLFIELEDLVNQNNMLEKMERCRNNIYHYAYGKRIGNGQIDFDRYKKSYKHILDEKPDYFSTIVLGKKGDIHYGYASDIQINTLTEQMPNRKLDDIIGHLWNICRIEMNILDYIVYEHYDFIKTKGYKINS